MSGTQICIGICPESKRHEHVWMLSGLLMLDARSVMKYVCACREFRISLEPVIRPRAWH